MVGAAKRCDSLSTGKAVSRQVVCLLEANKSQLCASAEYAVGVNVKELLERDHIWVPVTKAQCASV